MRDLRLEDGNDHRQEANAAACDVSADVEHGYRHARRLNDASSGEHAAGHQDRATPSERLGKGRQASSCKASCREERDNGATSGIGAGLEEERLERVGSDDFGYATA